MKTMTDLLRDADPLRHEPHPLQQERDRNRHALLAAVAGVAPSSSLRFRRPVAVLAAVALIMAGMVAVGSRIWTQGGGTLQAAVRFEVRLAEERQTAGLREARVAGSDRVVYLHDEAIVTNDDIAQSHVVQEGARFAVDVQFNAAGALKMRQATASHVGKPLAILIDGVVVMAPVLRTPISTSALVNGDFSKADADRIVNGIGTR
jgi:hypothetical protein